MFLLILLSSPKDIFFRKDIEKFAKNKWAVLRANLELTQGESLLNEGGNTRIVTKRVIMYNLRKRKGEDSEEGAPLAKKQE